MKREKENKFLFFIRRNALYLILTACILAVGLSITLMLINQQNDNSALVEPDVPVVIDPVPDVPVVEPDVPVVEPDEPVVEPDVPVVPDEPVDKPVIFIMPVENTTSIGAYSEIMVWNSTLGRFTAHLGIDFYAEEGTSVLAVYDGTIESVETSLIYGTTVTIDHGNGLKTVYNSLADGDMVVKGQAVKQGDVIGEVSVSNRQEYKDGAHLHFEVYENGEKIDPVKYLSFEEK